MDVKKKQKHGDVVASPEIRPSGLTPNFVVPPFFLSPLPTSSPWWYMDVVCWVGQGVGGHGFPA